MTIATNTQHGEIAADNCRLSLHVHEGQHVRQESVVRESVEVEINISYLQRMIDNDGIVIVNSDCSLQHQRNCQCNAGQRPLRMHKQAAQNDCVLHGGSWHN